MLKGSILLGQTKTIWFNSGFQKYFQNTGWMFVGQFSMIFSLIINIWLARYLGPENFGIISYVFAFVGIFGFLTNLGVHDILVRNLVKTPEKRDELMGTAFWLMMSGGILSFIVISAFGLILETSPLIRLLIVLDAIIVLFAPANAISAYFQATVQAKKNALTQIIGTVLTSILKIVFILTGQGVIWLMVAFVMDYVIGAIIHVLNYIRSGLKISNWKFKWSLAKIFLSSSYFLILSSATGFLLLKIDQLMVKFFLGEEAVGIYAAAVKLSEIWYFIPNIICASLFPAIVNAKIVSEQKYRKRLGRLYLFLTSIGLIIAIPISLSAPLLISILFGSSYISAIPVLQIYVWSGIGLFLGIGINRFFMTEDRLHSIFYYGLVAVITNVILNLYLIPTVGINGAAWATLISYTVGPIFFLTWDKIKLLKSTWSNKLR